MKVHTRCGLSILVCMLAIGHTVLAASEAELLYGQAQELEWQQRRSDAVLLYRQIVREYPDSPEAGPDHAGYQVHFADLKAAIYARDRVAVQSKANAIRQLASSPARKLEQLWGTGIELEQHGFYEEARLFYSEIIEKYPGSSIAGPDDAVYRTHLVDLRAALDAKDIVAARSAAEVIRQLPSSQPEKPWQLYRVGKLLEQNHLYEDALPFLQQVIDTYPDHLASGADDAGYLFHSTRLKIAAKERDVQAARSAAEAIRQLYSSRSKKPWQLYGAGRSLEKMGLRADARSFYLQVIVEYPDSRAAWLDHAGFRMNYMSIQQAASDRNMDAIRDLAKRLSDDTRTQTRGDREEVFRRATLAMCHIYLRNDEQVQSLTESIRSDYGRLEGVEYPVIEIAEEYHRAGSIFDDDTFYTKSVAMLKGVVSSMSSDKEYQASIYYTLGLSYRNLGHYARAADAFLTAYQTDPTHRYADYFLFAQARCNISLLENKVLSESEVKMTLNEIHSDLFSEHPQSKYIVFVESWLKDD